MNNIKEEVREKVKKKGYSPSLDLPFDYVNQAIDLTMKAMEKKVVEIIESCKVYRNTFITKKMLIKKLEEAFPEN